MPKLILTFKGKPLNVYFFEVGEVTVGRDENCSIRIDSLAVASTHAIISFSQHGDSIRPVADHTPVLVNGLKVEKYQLGHGDRISIGKHELSYDIDTKVINKNDLPKKEENNLEISNRRSKARADVIASLPIANLQILNGKNIGRLIPLKQALTKFGTPGINAAVIAKRKGGYFLSSLDDGSSIKVNKFAIDDAIVKLVHGDKIEVDSSTMRFLLDG